jgi:hypothetical protein
MDHVLGKMAQPSVQPQAYRSALNCVLSMGSYAATSSIHPLWSSVIGAAASPLANIFFFNRASMESECNED